MARYTTTIATPRSADDAFLFMADLRNFEKWDPSVDYSKLLSGTAPGPDAIYEVKVMASTLRYEPVEYSQVDRRYVFEARTARLRSYDIIEVAPADDGCEVTYDATFEVNGPVGTIANPLVKLFFNGLGDAAAEGMAKALDGRKIA